MIGISDYNEIVPLSLRVRLNEQPVKMRLEAQYDGNGKIIQPNIYVVGLGEKHFRNFDREIVRICDLFPWMKKRSIRFVLNELIVNTQFSMLRQIVKSVNDNRRAAGYFNVVLYPCGEFFSASIEEFGDFFDYYGYLESLEEIRYDDPDMYDDKSEMIVNGIAGLSEDKMKLVLTAKNDLVVAESSNKIALSIIEKATDQDFYVTSFYKNGVYMWKRLYFRVENDR
jgi:hypothetical protein